MPLLVMNKNIQKSLHHYHDSYDYEYTVIDDRLLATSLYLANLTLGNSPSDSEEDVDAWPGDAAMLCMSTSSDNVGESVSE